MTLSSEQLTRIVEAASISRVAREWTHPLYRYPASMSPHIARAIITELSNPGDTILDPFCGGGTTAVEALAQGRRVICSDLNTLACFVTESKAVPLSRDQLAFVQDWVDSITYPVRSYIRVKPAPLVTSDGASYVPRSCGLLLAIRDSIETLGDGKVQRLARLIVLRTGQVCFDCRQRALNPRVLLKAFRSVAHEAIGKMSEYSIQAERSGAHLQGRQAVQVIHTDAENLDVVAGGRLKDVSLVLTSPPYPGMHVLYHRWQFHGRKEVALPYQLLGVRDGASESHYTLGSRLEQKNTTYFRRVNRIFSMLNTRLERGTRIVQLIAFSRPQSQLRRYLDAMRCAGLAGIGLTDTESAISRMVPNRKWYIRTAARSPTRREYILIHESTGRSEG